MKLLHVDSSILGQGSVSRDLSADVVATFRGRHPDRAVIRAKGVVMSPEACNGAIASAKKESAAMAA